MIVLCFRCQGGLDATVTYVCWRDQGFVTGGSYKSNEGCRPYSFSSDCGMPCADVLHVKTPACEKTCQPMYDKDYDDDKYYGKHTQEKIPGWIKNLQQLLYNKIMHAILRFLGSEVYSLLSKHWPTDDVEPFTECKRGRFHYYAHITADSRRCKFIVSKCILVKLLIQKELMMFGPFEVCYQVYDDLQHYKEG